MTATPAPAAPAVPAELSNLDDRLSAWLGEGRAIEETITHQIVDHQRALEELRILWASARDAIDHMRELAGVAGGTPRASP